MNDRPAQDALEAPFSEATAALWRRHFRAASLPQDDEHTSESSVWVPAVSRAMALEAARRPAALAGERLPVTPLTRPPESEIRKSDRSDHGFTHTPGLLLIAVLTLQAVLSLRLVWSNTAFLDEATYLFGGHVEIAHWLHSAPLPPLATYFSGAPVIYPPLAALAASIGGLAAARLLSLAFMLAATALLWSTTSKLFGRRAAFFAAALFAVIGPTQALGAFATYDAMALFLLAAAAWCVVSAQNRDNSTLFLVAGMSVLALANATKYATAVLDPAVIALAAITVTRRRGLKPGFVRSGHLAAGTLGLVSVLLALGGPWYLAGVLSTTLSRAVGNRPASLILADASKWCGLVCVLAGLGVICALRRNERAQLVIVVVLAVSGTLVPLNQARIHTTTSLFKQVDFGVWFAAAAAGFAIAQVFGTGRRMWLRGGAATLAGILAVAWAGAAGRTQASNFFQEWPNSTQTMAALRNLTREYPGNYLAEDYDVPAYYLENSIPWQRWSQTWSFTYPSPDAHRLLSGAAAYQTAINEGHFALIALSFTDTTKIDSQIVADMRRAGTYHLVAAVPVQDDFGSGQVMVWAYKPGQAVHEGHHGHG
jgi:MFS family permease